jgi:molybdenum cofactor synthesis domain-containing protein
MRSSGALLPGQTIQPSTLLAPAQAILAYRARVTLAPPGKERVPLDAAFGRILAEDAVADACYPSHPRSTMDGFAMRSADRMAPRTIVGEILMGRPAPAPLGPGEAMRIPTGGAVPDGADAVVPVEDTEEADGRVTPTKAPKAADAITPAGEDMEPGDRVLAAGRRVDGAAMGVLATLGYTEVPVWRKPVVAIVSTGDELVDVSQRPGAGQVRDSNRFALAGALRQLGCEPLHLPRAVDEEPALEATLRDGLARADAVLLTGGSSVGVRDLTPRVVDRLGKPGVVVHGLRVRPGKPTVLAAIGTKPVIGLPGNPSSALMIFWTIAAAVLRGLTGETLRPTARPLARAGVAFRGKPGWTWFVPVVLAADGDARVATPLGIHSSHTSLLARAHGFVVISEDKSDIAEGEQIEVHAFDGGEL